MWPVPAECAKRKRQLQQSPRVYTLPFRCLSVIILKIFERDSWVLRAVFVIRPWAEVFKTTICNWAAQGKQIVFFLIYIYMYIKKVNIKCGRKSECLHFLHWLSGSHKSELSTSIFKALFWGLQVACSLNNTALITLPTTRLARKWLLHDVIVS